MPLRFDPQACPFDRAHQAQGTARKRRLARQRAIESSRQHAARAAAPAADAGPGPLPVKQSGKQALGSHYETLALGHLQRAGLALISRNVRGRMGEIDLIMRDGEVIVFVEVRARARTIFGGAAASITADKRARLIRTAAWLMPRLHTGSSRQPARLARFDVVAFDNDAIQWLPHAFALD